jgi:hypothetical protein
MHSHSFSALQPIVWALLTCSSSTTSGNLIARLTAVSASGGSVQNRIDRLSAFHFLCNLLLLEQRHQTFRSWSAAEVQHLTLWAADAPRVLYNVHQHANTLHATLLGFLRLLQDRNRIVIDAFTPSQFLAQLAVFFYFEKTANGKTNTASRFQQIGVQNQGLALALVHYLPGQSDVLDAAVAKAQTRVNVMQE